MGVAVANGVGHNGVCVGGGNVAVAGGWGVGELVVVGVAEGMVVAVGNDVGVKLAVGNGDGV